MKKAFTTVLAALLLLFTVFPIAAAAYSFSLDDYTLNAKASYLVNTDTGRVIADNNGEEKRSIASLTKIMTAVCVLDACDDLDKTVTVKGALVASIGETGLVNVGLQGGETMSVRNLLYCLLLPSAADAALVLADAIGGSVGAFVAAMNAKAAALGMENTHYVDPHGLHEIDDNHYSTAKDQAVLCAAAIQNRTFASIVSTAQYVVPATNLSGKRELQATNRLLVKDDPYRYENATGIKTGFTNGAGRCLASAATNGSEHYICIVLGCDSYQANGSAGVRQFQDSICLFETAFQSYALRSAFENTEALTSLRDKCFGINDEVQLVPEKDFTWLLKKGEVYTLDLNLPADRLSAPVAKGEVLGVCEISVGGKRVGSVNLVAVEAVERSFWRMAGTVLLVLLIALCLLLIAAKISRTVSRKRKQKARRQMAARRN